MTNQDEPAPWGVLVPDGAAGPVVLPGTCCAAVAVLRCLDTLEQRHADPSSRLGHDSRPGAYARVRHREQPQARLQEAPTVVLVARGQRNDTPGR